VAGEVRDEGVGDVDKEGELPTHLWPVSTNFFFLRSLTLRPNKLECLTLASFSSLVLRCRATYVCLRIVIDRVGFFTIISYLIF
jgi:hypothetical protein